MKTITTNSDDRDDESFIHCEATLSMNFLRVFLQPPCLSGWAVAALHILLSTPAQTKVSLQESMMGEQGR